MYCVLTMIDEQTSIMEQVEYWSTQNQSMSDQEVYLMFTPKLVFKFIKSFNRGCSPVIDGITSEHLHYVKQVFICIAGTSGNSAVTIG